MMDITKNLGRNVRFNLKIANYRPGQVVRYGDMPDGHRFWVDNKSILGAGRICEFTDEKPVPKEPGPVNLDPEKPDDSAIMAEAKKTIAKLVEENDGLLYKVEELTKENEKLIERVVELELSESDLKDKLAEFSADPAGNVIDTGTGSGAGETVIDKVATDPGADEKKSDQITGSDDLTKRKPGRPKKDENK